MENDYKYANTTVSLIKYHFVFCPRYRRKIFLIPNVEERFKELVKLKCEEMNVDIIAIECYSDHAYIFLRSTPSLSPDDIMRKIKRYTSDILKKEIIELSRMQNLWTRNYFVSTNVYVQKETIKEYVETQKKRYS